MIFSKAVLLTLFIILHLVKYLEAQEGTKDKSVLLILDLGISWKSTPISDGFCVDFTSPVMTAIGTGFIAGCVTIPSNYEKNIQGFGVSTGLQFYFPNTRLGVEYMPIFRYDYSHYDTWGRNRNIYSFFIDNHVNFYKYFKKKLNYIGIGYANLNSGAGFQYVSGARVLYHSLEFNAVSVCIGLVLYKNIFIEPKILYAPGGNQFNPLKHFAMASIRAYYRWQLN